MDIFTAIKPEKYFFRVFGLNYYTHVKGQGVVCQLSDSVSSLCVLSISLIATWAAIIQNYVHKNALFLGFQASVFATLSFTSFISNVVEIICFTLLTIAVFFQRHKFSKFVNFLHRTDCEIKRICDVNKMNKGYRLWRIADLALFTVIGSASVILNAQIDHDLLQTVANVAQIYKTLMIEIISLFLGGQIWLLYERTETLRRLLNDHRLDQDLSAIIFANTNRLCKATQLFNDAFKLIFGCLVFRFFIVTVTFSYSLVFIVLQNQIASFYYMYAMASIILVIILGRTSMVIWRCEGINSGLLEIQLKSSACFKEQKRDKMLVQRLHYSQQYLLTTFNMFNVDWKLLYAVRSSGYSSIRILICVFCSRLEPLSLRTLLYSCSFKFWNKCWYA